MADLATGATVLKGVGSVISAGGAIASGNASQVGANYKAAQLDQNAQGAIAAGQRSMFESQLKTRLTQGKLQSDAAGSGFAAGDGGIADLSGALAGRGEYQALTDMFNGKERATGLENEAAATRFSGSQAKTAGYINAAGTLASGLGSAISLQGKFDNPTTSGAAGTRA